MFLLRFKHNCNSTALKSAFGLFVSLVAAGRELRKAGLLYSYRYTDIVFILATVKAVQKI